MPTKEPPHRRNFTTTINRIWQKYNYQTPTNFRKKNWSIALYKILNQLIAVTVILISVLVCLIAGALAWREVTLGY